MTNKLLTRWVLAMLFSISAGTVAADDNDQLNRQMADYWAAYLDASPLVAAAYGAPGPRDKVDDLSPEARAATRARLDAHIEQLQAIEPGNLTRANREHYEAFEWMLRNERAILDHNSRYFSFSTVGGWQTYFAQIVLSLPYRSEQDYRDLLKRLGEFNRFAQQNIDLLREGIDAGYTQPCETLAGYEASISGYIAEDPQKSLFAIPFAAMPESIAAETRTELQAEAMAVIAGSINLGYAAYAKFFEQEYLPACREQVGLSSLPGGRAAYDQLLRYYISLDTDADTVHALGLSEVARIRKDMQAVIDEVEFDGDFADFLEFLRTDPQFYATDEQSYLNQVAWVAKSIDGKLPGFFARLPSNPYGIMPVPAQTAPKTATAYYQPGAADGTRAGQYFINTYKLDSRPLYELPALSLHEGVPGHHLQFSFQGENTAMPDWRRSYYFHAYGEGWGLYSEYLGIEMGMYNTPYERFGRMIYEMWRAVRLVVDTGMHAKGWTRQQAIDYMLANTGLAEQNVVSEVDRYITYPGQATSYKHGELKIRELRKRAEKALGAEFDLRQFHVEVLEGGSLPLSVLEAKIDRWISSLE